MANLQLPHTFLGGATIEAQEVNSNFAALAAKFGALTAQDLSASAKILNSQLANDDYELLIPFSIVETGTAAAGLNTAVGDFHLIGAIPYDATDGPVQYTVLGIEHMTYAQGARTAAVFDLDVGTAAQFNAATGFTEIATGITTGSGSSTWQTTRLSSFTATTFTLSASTPLFLRLEVTTQGASWAAGDSWNLTIKLKRTNGLRS